MQSTVARITEPLIEGPKGVKDLNQNGNEMNWLVTK